MPEYDNTNRGSVWPNDRKREGKQDPEYTGSLNVEGVEYWVSAWKKKPDANPKAPSLSFSIKRKEDKPSREIPPKIQAEADFDDDIPF